MRRTGPDPDAEWWTTSDVAAYLGVRVGTVSSYHLRGQMPEPDLTVGRTHMWRPARIAEWQAARPRPGVGGRPIRTKDLRATRHDDHHVETQVAASTPVKVLDEQSARTALAEACQAAGLDPVDAELIRLGSNAVFRLGAEPVIARVGRDARRLPDAERELAVSRWLSQFKVPAVRALRVPQPIVADGRVVTLWESLSEREEYGSTAELAALLRQLHALAVPADLDLPLLAPFDPARQRLPGLTTIGDDDRRFLLERSARLNEAYDALNYSLPVGVIHGDASVGNVIRDRQGHALLADLDGFAVGPREWDLVLTAIYFERFGWHTEGEYRSFVAGYGYDVMTWSGYPVLRDVRELLMVSWLAQNADDPAVARELAMRIDTLRTDSSRLTWKAH